jgi:hypothetical protein
MKKVFSFFNVFYKGFVSGTIKLLFGGGCRYTPTCSQYAAQALEKYGVLKGTLMALKRVLRCNPWGGQGFDSVP